jgi:thiol-disulfide isomerase/thioredoxin
MIRFDRPLVFALSVALTLVIAGRLDADDKPLQLDAQIEQALRKSAEFLQQQKNFRLVIEADARVESKGVKESMTSKYGVSVARPQRVAVRLIEGDSGVTLVSDGKQIARGVDALKKYAIGAAPGEIDEVFADPAVAMIGLGMAEPFFHALFSEDAYEGLLAGVTLARTAKSEKIDGHDCLRFHFEQQEYDWEIWIDSGDRPLVRKLTCDPAKTFAAGNAAGTDIKVFVSFAFRDWNLQPKWTNDEFVFTPAVDWEKVDHLFGEGGEETIHPLLGMVAPAFTLERLTGGQTDLARHRDKDVVILDFWATWCGPCRKALPTIAKVAKEYRDKGVVFYAVDLEEEPNDVRKFLADQKLDLPVILDRDGEIGKLYRAEGIPQTVLVGKDGTVQVVHVGLLPDLETRLSKELEDLVAGKDLAQQTREAAAAKASGQAAEGMELAWSRDGAWTGVSLANDDLVYAVGPGGQVATFNAQGEEVANNKILDNPTFIRAANLAGDKVRELVTFTTWGPAVKAHTIAGELLWSYAKGQGVDDVWTVDLNGDGLDEVVIGYNGATGLHVLDNTGNLLWSNNSIGNVWHVTAGNVVGDGAPEVLTTSAVGKVHIFGADGKHRYDLDPGLYGHMVRTWHNAKDKKSLDLIIVAGTGQPKEMVVGLNEKGDRQWKLDIPARVESAMTALEKPWLAIALADRSVRVVNVLNGQQIGQAPGQGARSDVAWLSVRDVSPLLIVATGSALRAYKLADK